MTAMEYRRMGRSGLAVSALCLGCWTFGREVAEPDAHRIIRRFVEAGGTFLDTADGYALGLSEEITGRAIRGLRDQVVLATKVFFPMGPGLNERGLSRAHIMRACDASLKRLGTDYIDLYQPHCWDMTTPLEETLGALSDMVHQGKVRYIGVSNFSVEQMQRIQKIAPITSLQPPYSMLRRAIEAEILPFAQANNIGVINYSPMVAGLLTGKMTAERAAALPADDWRRRGVEFQEPRLSRNLRLVEVLREIGNGHNVSPGVVAVAWTLHHTAITAAIVGGRNAQQVEGIAPALEFRLRDEEYRRINSFLEANPV